MTDATKAPRERPLSPHLTQWRWHLTMATSILHRASGVALYVGALIAAAWAVSLACGPETYAGFKGLLGSPLGKLVMFGLSAAFFYHLANGVRHLVWDAGYALDLKNAELGAYIVAGASLGLTIITWIVALAVW